MARGEDGLASAVWSETDRALACAWRDVRRLDAALLKAERACKKGRARKSELKTRLEAAAAEALSLRQTLNIAAQWRGLEAFGKVGEKVAFDPELHALENDETGFERVKIRRQGVKRSVGGRSIVLAKASVSGIRSRP
jgi:hypothetical protein